MKVNFAFASQDTHGCPVGGAEEGVALPEHRCVPHSQRGLAPGKHGHITALSSRIVAMNISESDGNAPNYLGTTSQPPKAQKPLSRKSLGSKDLYYFIFHRLNVDFGMICNDAFSASERPIPSLRTFIS